MEEEVIALAQKAGAAILKIYESHSVAIKIKSDNSPVTLADTTAHDILVAGLAKYGWPVMSEEGNIPSFQERQHWTMYWCVDPLDGTKEFIKKNGEFTLNVALMEGGKPTFGIIYVPVKDQLFVGGVSYPAQKIQNGKSINLPISKSRSLQDIKSNTKAKVAVSRSYTNEQTELFLQGCETNQTIAMGSSLKFLSIIEGQAHIYPRFAPCMEWDTAAAHAILNSLGYAIYKLDGRSEIEYNKPNLLNPHFLCY